MIEEIKAVRMSYCELGVGWVGGWVSTLGLRAAASFSFSSSSFSFFFLLCSSMWCWSR